MFSLRQLKKRDYVEIMKALIIDSSSSACSVAVTSAESVIGHSQCPMERGHDSALIPMIKDTLMLAKTDVWELKFVAVTIGPGSFTGLRISLAAAKGIALSANIPLIGISCFDAIAGRIKTDSKLPKTDLLLIALASKRKELYIECLNKNGAPVIMGQALSVPETLIKIQEIYKFNQTIRLAGDAGLILLNELRKIIKPSSLILSENFEGIDALDLTKTANFRNQLTKTDQSDYQSQTTINYVRKPDISPPQGK